MNSPLRPRAATLLARIEAHPLFQCGFRPFFAITAASAVLFMGIWLATLAGWLPWLQAWPLPGGLVAWHAHELVYGFGMASITGFLLTAVPEFTGRAAASRRRMLVLVLLWVGARLAFLLAPAWPPVIGIWPAALCNLGLLATLLAQLAPALWRDPARRHLSFAWSLAALAVLEAGFFVSLQSGGHAMAWLHAAVGLLMILIIVATSRISLRVVNGRLEDGRAGAEVPVDAPYVARPPRRHLATFAIGLCSVAEFVLGANAVTGWLALAAAAAVLNLLGDWHVGRRLLTRWALMLYASYWLMASGYGLMGISWLGVALPASAGRHLLMAGTAAISIYAVMSIAGRLHAGQWLDRRIWLPVAGVAIVIAALLRALAGVPLVAGWGSPVLLASGVLWGLAFGAYLWHAWPVLARPRNDHAGGCAEPVPAQASRHSSQAPAGSCRH
jgi:uncharacterized protein involved in response to NO